MAAFQLLKRQLEAAVCKGCNGIGEANDADFGDISFNTWKCEPCKGSGFKDGQLLSLVNQTTTKESV